MATITNSTNLAVYIGGVKVGCSTDASLSVAHALRDISCKDSAAWTDVAPGIRSWNISGSGLYAYDSTYGGDELINALTDRTLLTVELSTEVSGETRWSGSGYLTECSVSSPGREENVSYSFTIEGNGALTSATA